MQYSKQGIDLTKSFESCRLTAYKDIKGVLTIGYRHTGDEVVEGLVWTQDQADTQLVMDLQRAENMVDTCVTVQLTQGQYDAMVDFAFNLGGVALVLGGDGAPNERARCGIAQIDD